MGQMAVARSLVRHHVRRAAPDVRAPDREGQTKGVDASGKWGELPYSRPIDC